MSAIILRFPAAVRTDAGEAVHRILRWAEKAGRHGWYVVATDTASPDEPSFIIGHRAVDDDGVFQLRQVYDGWEVLARSGALLMFDSLIDALANICPVGAAA
jgi:hypothetical protein